MLYVSKKVAIIFITLHFITLCLFAHEKSKVQITSTKINKCINIPQAQTKEGVELIVWNSFDFGLNQQWQIHKVADYYIIQSIYNNLVMSAVNNSVIQKKYDGNNMQHWLIDSTSNGFMIRSLATSKVLTITDSNSYSLFLNDSDKSLLQLWKFEKTGIENYQAEFNKLLTVSEMHEDINYFFSKLNEVHVNPYAFCTKDSIELRKQELLERINTPLRKIEFNQIISCLNGLFDSHTNINRFDIDYYNTYSYGYGKIFPYQIKYSNGNIFLSSKIDSLKHLKLLSINGVTIKSILNELNQRFNYEIQHVTNANIEENFQYYLFGILNMEAPFVINGYDTLDLKNKRIETNGITRFQLENLFKKEYDFRIYAEDSIAIIEHNTCRIKDLERFNNNIDSIFNIIIQQNIKYLFIDISKNTGGSSHKNHVFYRNLAHEPKTWVEKTQMKITLDSKMHTCHLSRYFSNKSFEERYNKYLEYINSDKLTQYQKNIVKYENGYIRNSKSYNYNFKNKITYHNKIFLIQGHNTYSAGVEMAAWFKYGKVGTIIGSETGGTTAVYIESIPFYMKNSNIKFSIADKFSTYPNGKLNQGIKPDIDLGEGFCKQKFSLDDLKQYLSKIDNLEPK